MDSNQKERKAVMQKNSSVNKINELKSNISKNISCKRKCSNNVNHDKIFTRSVHKNYNKDTSTSTKIKKGKTIKKPHDKTEKHENPDTDTFLGATNEETQNALNENVTKIDDNNIKVNHSSHETSENKFHCLTFCMNSTMIHEVKESLNDIIYKICNNQTMQQIKDEFKIVKKNINFEKSGETKYCQTFKETHLCSRNMENLNTKMNNNKYPNHDFDHTKCESGKQLLINLGEEKCEALQTKITELKVIATMPEGNTDSEIKIVSEKSDCSKWTSEALSKYKEDIEKDTIELEHKLTVKCDGIMGDNLSSEITVDKNNFILQENQSLKKEIIVNNALKENKLSSTKPLDKAINLNCKVPNKSKNKWSVPLKTETPTSTCSSKKELTIFCMSALDYDKKCSTTEKNNCLRDEDIEYKAKDKKEFHTTYNLEDYKIGQKPFTVSIHESSQSTNNFDIACEKFQNNKECLKMDDYSNEQNIQIFLKNGNRLVNSEIRPEIAQNHFSDEIYITTTNIENISKETNTNLIPHKQKDEETTVKNTLPQSFNDSQANSNKSLVEKTNELIPNYFTKESHTNKILNTKLNKEILSQIHKEKINIGNTFNLITATDIMHVKYDNKNGFDNVNSTSSTDEKIKTTLTKTLTAGFLEEASRKEANKSYEKHSEKIFNNEKQNLIKCNTSASQYNAEINHSEENETRHVEIVKNGIADNLSDFDEYMDMDDDFSLTASQLSKLDADEQLQAIYLNNKKSTGQQTNIFIPSYSEKTDDIKEIISQLHYLREAVDDIKKWIHTK